MPFFDLHCHPSFKSALSDLDVNNCPSPIPPVDVSGTGLLAPCINLIAGSSLDSQSSFSQIPSGSLVVASFLAFERAYTFIRELRKLNPLDKRILDNIQNQVDSYHTNMTSRDVHHFLRHIPIPTPDRQYVLINSITQYPQPPAPNTVYVIGSVEGAHNFYTIADIAQQEDPTNQHTIVEALQIWKQQSNQNPDVFPRLLYISLCHHAQNVIANHAWAIPLTFDPGTLTVGSFDPSGDGLSETGRAFIQTALRQDNQEKRILIDIKHLGIKARQDFYALRENEFPDVPILATHMGINGTSWDRPPLNFDPIPFDDDPNCLIVRYREIGGFIRQVPPKGPSPQDQFEAIPFNPWSINLYNEDIEQVMRSRGLIGVSMDRRIIGAQLTSAFVDPERFSRKDFPPGWLHNPAPPFSLYPQEPLPPLFSGIQAKAIQDQWTFAQQVVHIILISELAKNDGRLPQDLNPWDHICLGSDYDGLIHGLFTAETARTLDRLFNNRLQLFIEEMIRHLVSHGVLGNTVRVPNDVIRKLSLDNGVTFLRNHFV